MDLDAPDTLPEERTDPSTTTGPRLQRSAVDRYLGGVAGGIGERFGLDPFLIRAALLAATLFATYAAGWLPVVPVGYVALWMVLPGPTGRSALREMATDAGRREVVAALASLIVLAVLLSRPAFGFALALAAVAWVLLSEDTVSIARPSVGASPYTDRAPSPPGPSADEEVDGDNPLSEPATPHAGPVPEAQARSSLAATWGRRRRADRGEELVAGFGRTPRRPLREPALWPLTLSLLAMIAVGGLMADSLLERGVEPAVIVNLGLVAIGGVLALSAWRGRALGTIVLAVALLPAWIGFSVADIGRFDGAGSSTHTPTALPASGRLAYENGYGSMTIDLRQLPMADGDRLTLDIGATAGTVDVLVPSTTDTVLRSHVGLGTTTVEGAGIGFYEYDREPHMDRSMIRRYDAHGSGCIQDYWASWELLVESHERAGVEFAGLSAAVADDVEPIVTAIVDAGFAEPRPVDDEQFVPDAPQPYYDDLGNEYYALPNGDLEPVQQLGEFESPDRPISVYDAYGNQYFITAGTGLQTDPSAPLAQPAPADLTGERTWSFVAGEDGLPCVEVPPPDDPAVIEINATIGIGNLEVHRDGF